MANGHRYRLDPTARIAPYPFGTLLLGDGARKEKLLLGDGARKELWRLVDVGAVSPCAW
jgi:hypothetical protein